MSLSLLSRSIRKTSNNTLAFTFEAQIPNKIIPNWKIWKNFFVWHCSKIHTREIFKATMQYLKRGIKRPPAPPQTKNPLTHLPTWIFNPLASLSQLTSSYFILSHGAGFYNPTIPQYPPSHLYDYSSCNSARLDHEFFRNPKELPKINK